MADCRQFCFPCSSSRSRTSTAHPGDEAAAGGGETVTSRNTTAATSLGVLRASDSHRCRLERDIR